MSSDFKYCGSCNCTGTSNVKFCSGDYIVYYLPKRKLFHIKHLKNYILKNQPVSTLCENLKHLGFPESADFLSIS